MIRVCNLCRPTCHSKEHVGGAGRLDLPHVVGFHLTHLKAFSAAFVPQPHSISRAVSNACCSEVELSHSFQCARISNCEDSNLQNASVLADLVFPEEPIGMSESSPPPFI